MPIVPCKICKKKFYAKPFWIKRGFGKFCSKKCQHEGQKNGKILRCFTCEKEVYKTKRSIDRSKSGKNFCSKSCQTTWRNTYFAGKKHKNWKEGRYAYRNIIIRNRIPEECSVCKLKDKRVLVVHHKDGHREHNNIENLVWLCHNCHILVHHYGEKLN